MLENAIKKNKNKPVTQQDFSGHTTNLKLVVCFHVSKPVRTFSGHRCRLSQLLCLCKKLNEERSKWSHISTNKPDFTDRQSLYERANKRGINHLSIE